MDLWDLTKVLVRRWYVTVPMVLATFAAAAWITTTTGPEYEATGHVAVIPPEVRQVAEAGEPLRVSPWNEEALAHAAQIRLETTRLREELAQAGFHGEWSVDVTGRLPVVSLAVVAPTAEQAVDTLHELQAVVEDEVRLRQEGHDVPEAERFQTVRYDTGESIETTTSSVRRALVAILGAGAVLTVALVVAFDALARAWRRRRAGPDGIPGPIGYAYGPVAPGGRLPRLPANGGGYHLAAAPPRPTRLPPGAVLPPPDEPAGHPTGDTPPEDRPVGDRPAGDRRSRTELRARRR